MKKCPFNRDYCTPKCALYDNNDRCCMFENISDYLSMIAKALEKL